MRRERARNLAPTWIAVAARPSHGDPVAGLPAPYGSAAVADAISATVDRLSPNGELLALAVLTDPLTVNSLQLVIGSKSVKGQPGGTPMDVEDPFRFAALHDIRPMIEEVPLDDGRRPTGECSTIKPDSAWFSSSGTERRTSHEAGTGALG